MICYVIASLILIVYFELLGQYISIKSKLKDYISKFAYGFLTFIAITYITTSYFTGTGVLVWPIFALYTLLIIIGFVLICINFREIKQGIKISNIFMILLFTFILCLYSYRTTLGNIYGFDTEFYAGMVSTNSTSTYFNEIYPTFGVRWNQTNYQYSFQTYYYFASYIVKILRALSIACNIEINNLSSFSWVFQILSSYLLVSLVFNTINKCSKRKVLFNVFIIAAIIFFYGKWYFNNVFGFFGNTFKIYCFGCASLLMFDYKNIDKKSFKVLYAICLLASCAFSSSSLFICSLTLFGYFFAFIEEDEKVFRYIALVMVIPLVNLLIYLTQRITEALFISFICCGLLFLLNDILIKLFKKRLLRIALLLFVCALMALLSYKITGNIFDFNAFVDNLGTKADMTFNYFDIFGFSQKNVFCLLTDISLFFYMFKFRNEKISIICWVLIIAILNPFCCSYINSINSVYYRSYDIFINPCTFIVFTYYMFEEIKPKYLYNFLLIGITLFFVLRSNILKPLYYHESFIPSNDYNGELRMNNDEYDVIKFIKSDSEYRGISEPYILNNNLLNQSIMPNGRYVFSRNDKPWHIWGADLQLFYIFYPVNKLSEEERPGIPDYDRLDEYIKNSEIDYIVVDKELEYHDNEEKQYGFLFYKIQQYEYKNIYENNSYVVLVY